MWEKVDNKLIDDNNGGNGMNGMSMLVIELVVTCASHHRDNAYASPSSKVG